MTDNNDCPNLSPSDDKYDTNLLGKIYFCLLFIYMIPFFISVLKNISAFFKRCSQKDHIKTFTPIYTSLLLFSIGKENIQSNSLAYICRFLDGVIALFNDGGYLDLYGEYALSFICTMMLQCLFNLSCWNWRGITVGNTNKWIQNFTSVWILVNGFMIVPISGTILYYYTNDLCGVLLE